MYREVEIIRIGNCNNHMIDTNHLLKVTAAWISIVYIICFGGVALLPGIRGWFMLYALHTDVSSFANVITLGTFISGFVIWNIVAAIAVWIFAFLWNAFRRS